MKKILVTLIASVLIAAQVNAGPISELLIKKFNEAFPTATDVRWFEGKDFYQVTFKKDDILCKIDYAADGTINRTLRYYQEKDLCPFIALRVNEKYKGRAIKGVVELQNNDGLMYEIVMHDATRWYIVNSDSDGNMKVKKTFRKA